jgi:hypothetical protein
VKLFKSAGLLLAALAFVAAASRTAAAQTDISTTDIQRLQDAIFDASRDVAQLRSRDASLASRLERELDDARDDVTYLRVKARRHEPVSSSEYADARDRIEDIRARARGDAGGRYSIPPDVRSAPDDRPRLPRGVVRREDGSYEIPVDTEFDVRLQDPLGSGTSRPEDRFEATTLVDLRDENGRVIVPAGSVMRGVVNSVTKATRTERKGAMSVAFERITIGNRSYPIRATVAQALESEGIMGEKERIGIGAGAGAILGAILGGAKGALAGILIGGGGTIAATEGRDVELPAGTVLRVRMDSPLNVPAR